MRHGLRELPGHARGRRHRVLPGGADSTLALSPKLRPAPDTTRNHWTENRLAQAATSRLHAALARQFTMARDHHRDHASGPSQRALRAGEVIRHAIAEILA